MRSERLFAGCMAVLLIIGGIFGSGSISEDQEHIDNPITLLIKIYQEFGKTVMQQACLQYMDEKIFRDIGDELVTM